MHNFKNVVNTKLSSQIVYKFMRSWSKQLIWSNSKTFFVRASEQLGITPLTVKFVKMPIKSAIFDHMLLDGHKARHMVIILLLKESN